MTLSEFITIPIYFPTACYISENIARGWKINWDCNKLGQCHLNCEHDKFGSKIYHNAVKVVNPNSKHGLIGDKMVPIEAVSCTYEEDISGCRTVELPQIPPGQWSCKVTGTSDKTCDLSCPDGNVLKNVVFCNDSEWDSINYDLDFLFFTNLC
jgi:hypothetical protein